jgi:hypothetical protein
MIALLLMACSARQREFVITDVDTECPVAVGDHALLAVDSGSWTITFADLPPMSCDRAQGAFLCDLNLSSDLVSFGTMTNVRSHAALSFEVGDVELRGLLDVGNSCVGWDCELFADNCVASTLVAIQL